MTSSAPQPRPLPKFPFLLAQGLLVAFGAFLLFFAPEPFAAGTLFLVLLAVLVGTGLALVPFLWGVRPRRAADVRRASPIPAPAPAPEGERWAELGEELAALRSAVDALAERGPAEGAESWSPRVEESLAALGRDLETLREEVQVLRSHQASRSFVETGLLRQEELLRRLESRQEEVYRLVRRIGPLGGPLAPGGGAAAAPAAPPPPADAPEAAPAPGRSASAADPPAAGPPEPAPEPEETSLPTRLRVSAFLHPENRICLRGEGGGLSPEEGVPLTMTGVGEWTWEGVLDEPLECELRLNDAMPSDLGRLRLFPGDDLTLAPSFGGEENG